MQSQLFSSINAILPEIIILISIIMCLVLDLILNRKSYLISLIAISGLLISLFFVYMRSDLSQSLFNGMIVNDPFSVFFKFIFILSSIFVILFTLVSREMKLSVHKNEHTFLILSLVFGSFLMCSSVNLIMVYLSLELVSLTSYILAGYTKKDKASSEAAMKYVIYGAASSGIMIYGISLLYGLTGKFNIYEIAMFLSANATVNEPVLILSIVMIIAGIGYKISSVPFHFWTPDVYQGAPIPITSFLAVTSSSAGFALLIRFFKVTFIQSFQYGIDGSWQVINSIKWNEIIIILSIASMVFGNFVALWQTSLKRILAYSSIAHTGYMILGLVVMNEMGITAILIYQFVYLFMTLGAFYVTIMLANKVGTDDISDMKGLAFRAPLQCVGMAIFMFSLSGIPSTAGFIGKFYIFSTLVNSHLVWLALIAMLNSVISLFFYVKVLKVMFFADQSKKEEPKIKFALAQNLLLFLLIIPTILFGIYFLPVLKLAKSSAVMFGFM